MEDPRFRGQYSSARMIVIVLRARDYMKDARATRWSAPHRRGTVYFPVRMAGLHVTSGGDRYFGSAARCRSKYRSQSLPIWPRAGTNDAAGDANYGGHLFAGSDGGGEHWAVVSSLIETCKMNAVDPQA